MLVELKNGDTYNGRLVNCDSWMNINLREVSYACRATNDGNLATHTIPRHATRTGHAPAAAAELADSNLPTLAVSPPGDMYL